MKWLDYWQQLASTEQDPLRQVARVRSQGDFEQEDIEKLAGHLAHLLDLQPGDRLLDLCCGNGLLTQRLATRCADITGVDLAPAMIQTAKAQFSAPNISYLVGNVVEVDRLVNGPFDKILLHFSFQYLERKEGEQALAAMSKLLTPTGRIVLGDVPERERLVNFYRNPLIRARYKLDRLRGKDNMGKFWSTAELQQAIAPLGLQLNRKAQPEGFPYAHYRADFVIYR
ncbi:MAG: class I SAM-dependent methyltransferase [Bacteroidia bacterium]|nr:class I SAM-dependent methyltransferase [Bacteroidia bacterium]